jgi:hypothetical protein
MSSHKPGPKTPAHRLAIETDLAIRFLNREMVLRFIYKEDGDLDCICMSADSEPLEFRCIGHSYEDAWTYLVYFDEERLAGQNADDAVSPAASQAEGGRHEG